MKRKVTSHTEPDDTPKVPLVLLKFGQLEYLQQLLNGSFYLNSIQYFRDLEKKEVQEDDDLRFDPVEGASEYLCTGAATVTFSSLKNQDGSPLTLPIVSLETHKSQKVIYGNIGSFYGVTTDCFDGNHLIPVDTRMKKFGQHFIMIKNFNEFVRRVDIAIGESCKISWEHGFVKYTDRYHGNFPRFRKRSKFSFQKEFRMHFKTGNAEAFRVNIGNIQDIATILSSDILEYLEMTLDMKNHSCNVRWPIIN